jgi:glutamyl-tRNA synthetase
MTDEPTAPRPRVRFAPSPTGYLHVGGARTALFNWLFARSQGGAFVLRIEDTDRERSSGAMTAAILEGMTWLGLDWDEGPLHQADGVDRHRGDVEQLLAAGHAYRCFCSPAALDVRRAAAAGAAAAGAYRYDRHCLAHVPPGDAERRAAAGEPHAVRFRVPEGITAWDDVVHGPTRFANEDIEDFVVLRSDGTPIYNMAVVSDDLYMRITHVLRGDDHLSNTPKQILLYRALGHEPPVFAHLPMILGPDGKRLSKRHGATAIGEYRARGILPWAMVNFLALLGWSPGDDQEVFGGPEELVARFTPERINRKSAIFDTTKLEWLNGQHLSRFPVTELEPLVLDALRRRGGATGEDAAGGGVTAAAAADAAVQRGLGGPAAFRALLDLLKLRARSIDDIARQTLAYLIDPVSYDADAAAKHWQQPAEVRDRLAALRDRLAAADWDAAALEEALRHLADELGIGAGKLIHPLRVALTGAAASPGIFDVLLVLGRDRSVRRLDDALGALAQRAAASSPGPA